MNQKLNMEETSKENPYDSAGVLSRIFFWWFNQYEIIGLKRRLKETDLCKPPKGDDSEYLGNLLQIEWNKELKKKYPSLLKSLIRIFGSKCVLICIINLFQDCFVLIIQAYLIGIVIDYFEYKFEEKILGIYLSAVGVCVCLLLHIILYHIFVFLSERLSAKIGTAISSIIYKKSLKLSHASLGKSHIGQMVNLLSNDIMKFRVCINYSVYVIIGPIQMIILIIMLWHYIGPAAFAGISIPLIYIPLQIGLSRIFSLLKLKTAKLSDKRLHLMNELLSGMRVIKMYAWETLFLESLEKTRRKEIQDIKKSLFIHGIPFTMGIIFTKITLYFSFFVYFMIEGKLSATVAFVSFILLVNTYRTMFFIFPQGASIAAEAYVSLKRIQKFLLLEEIHKTIDIQDSRPCLKDCGVWVENISVSWNKDTEPTLQDISFNGKAGDLIVIVGSVGSGKTSLIMALLGEVPISSGKIILKGKLSYSSQEPWIYSGTIRENILFCENYDEKKYKEVLYVSALEKDIGDFPEGDLTLVGERGSIMSGGQKARINLARAIYHDADIFILDDPFSAVDAPVAKHIFENCIQKYLKKKVTILVTHQIRFLKAATKIILLKEGKIQAVGDYNELSRLRINFGLFSHTDKRATEIISDSLKHSIHDSLISRPEGTSQNVDNVTKVIYTKEEKIQVKTFESENPDNIKRKKFSSAIAYTSYINSGISRIFQISLLFLFLLTQALINFSDYWIVKWTKRGNYSVRAENEFEKSTIKADKNINIVNCTESKIFPIINDEMNMYIYSGLIAGLTISSLIATVSYFILCSKCSFSLHRKLLHCIIRAPIAFHDKNPVGRMLNRFSTDMCIIDQQLPISTLFVINICINILGMIVLQIIFQPYLIIPSFILILAIGVLLYLFMGVTTDIQHLEWSAVSPIFSHLATSLYGISTIRAFKAERNFEYIYDKFKNKHTTCRFFRTCTFHWNTMKIHIFSFINFVITVVTLFIASSTITGAEVGLIMAYSLAVMIIFIQMFSLIIQTESELISVERILDYSKLSSEGPLTSTPDKQPHSNWPEKGDIEFNDVSLQYEGDTKYVLKNLNFHIKSEEKIGIVGRTGAGKSSIIAALFRMVETEGVISIDGIATKDIGLHILRSKISIIPQDPLLFTGSLRRNIDPFNKLTDETIWKVLEELQLKNTVQNLKGGLDAELSESGSNFSVGERQLICVARAIFNQNKILVLDEATAFIDKETDSIIQKTIRKKFASSTILTIAHRLQTVMDSDRVMVLQDGKIEEFDKPFQLLKNPESIFYNMVKMAGKEMSRYLNNIAEETKGKD